MLGGWMSDLCGIGASLGHRNGGLLGRQNDCAGLLGRQIGSIVRQPTEDNVYTEQMLRHLLSVLEIGDRPNVESFVFDKPVWKTVETRKGWCCQVHQVFDTARVVSPEGIRMANGSRTAMVEKMRRLASKEFVRPGDILGVSRGGLYEHYAIYAGDGKVIHYCGKGQGFGDFGGAITVHEAPFSEFIKDSVNYFVLWFDDGKPVRLQSATTFLFSQGWAASEEFYNRRKYSVYSAEETLKRARSRIGEEQYNLVTNNCEHFAMWCRTGKAESAQVNRFLGLRNIEAYRGIFSETGGVLKYLE